MFQIVPLSIIRSFSLYTQQWFMSYSFADSLRAGSGWNLEINLSGWFYYKKSLRSVHSKGTVILQSNGNYSPNDGMSRPTKFEYSATLLQESQNLRKKCGGCTMASNGMMVIESYIEIIQLVKKLNWGGHIYSTVLMQVSLFCF